jgi:hypothetical protein
VPLAQTQRELAGYPYISATAFQVAQGFKGTEPQDLATDKKVFIRTYLNKYRVVGCVDSGSDLSIMHESLFSKIFSCKRVTSQS